MNYQESIERALRAAWRRKDVEAVVRLTEWLSDVRAREGKVETL